MILKFSIIEINFIYALSEIVKYEPTFSLFSAVS